VLLHPLGADRRFWEPITALLSGFEVITYDFPGHGTSPVPKGGVTIHDLALQLADLLSADEIERAHIAGVSLGGLVAQQMAVVAPHLLGRLALVDTVAVYPPEWYDQWQGRARTARSQGLDPLVAPSLDVWFTADFIAAEGRGVRYLRETLSTADPEGYALTCEALAAADTSATAAGIGVPTLVLCGEEDGPAFVSGARWLAGTIPDARLRWLPGRHAAALENPDTFACVLAEFLHEDDAHKGEGR
jgi:3-oxoadipate enol-lactonase